MVSDRPIFWKQSRIFATETKAFARIPLKIILVKIWLSDILRCPCLISELTYAHRTIVKYSSTDSDKMV